MPDGNDQALLDHITTGLHRLTGLPEAIVHPPGHLQTKRNAEWVRSQFDADPAMRQDYLQAAVMHLTFSRTSRPASSATSKPWSPTSPPTA